MAASPWSLILSLVFLRVRHFSYAASQVTVYEAGAVQWAQRGNVQTVARPTLATTCPLLMVADDGQEQAFVLSSSEDIVALDFNGTEIAIYGVAYASNSCELGTNPTRALLDVLPPPSPTPTSTSASSTASGPHSGNGPTVPSCIPFMQTSATCGVLLARWTQLDRRNRHRLYISTNGQKIAILNATVSLNLDASAPDPDEPPALELPQLPSAFGAPSTVTEGLTSHVSRVSVSESPSPPSLPTHQRYTQPAQIAMYALLGLVGALCLILGLLFVRWRARRRRTPPVSKPPESEFADTDSSPALTSPSPPPPPISLPQQDPHIAEKHHSVKTLFRPRDAMSSANATIAPSDDQDLDRAIEGTGLTRQELIASLNRLRDHGGASRSLGRSTSRDSMSPPRYDD